MVIKVGINSFGRIGRVIFRTCCQNSEIEVSAINDPAIELDYICYLIKFDSTHGKYTETVSYHGDEIQVNGRSVKVFHHKVPADIPWNQAGVQYVLEASGMFTSLAKASGHFASDSVRRVLVTAPSADAPMLILGVNEDKIQSEAKVISCGSSTLYCLAPIVKVLEDAFGVVEGCVTSIHAMTPSLKPLDGLCVRGKHWRDHRSIHQNIIPASTGACKALGKIIPSCKDKLVGLAFRVPIVDVSVLDISIRLNKTTTVTEISQAIQRIKNPALRNIIQISNEKSVSSDYMGDKHSCILDIDSSMQITPNFLKLICWYENEYSYSCRVVETILFSERQFQTRIVPPISIAHKRSVFCKTLSKLQLTESNKNFSQRCVPLRISKLKNDRSSIKSDSNNFIIRPTTLQGSAIFSEPTDLKTETFKSYIDRLTKCECKAVQNKMRTNPPAKALERAKSQDLLKKVEKEISKMINMSEELLNKRANKKSSTLTNASKEIHEKELASLRENIITKIADAIKKIKTERNNRVIEICGDKALILDVDDYQDKVSTNEINSFINSETENQKSNLSSKIPSNNLVRSNLSLKTSNAVVKDYHCDLNDLTKANKIHQLSKITSNNVVRSNLSLKTSNAVVKDYHCDLNDLTKANKIHQLSKTKKSLISNDFKLQISKEYTPLIKGNDSSSLADTNVQEMNTDDEVIFIVSENFEPAIKVLNENPQDNLNVSDKFLNNRGTEIRSINNNELKIQALATEDTTPSACVVDISNIEIEPKVEPVCVKMIEQQYVVPVETVTESVLVDTNYNDNSIQDQSADNKKLEQNHQAIAGCSSNQKLCQKCISNPIENNYKKMMCADYNVPSESKKIGDTERNFKDIYDKLDSTSVSDSESSYHMHEKKSEIINISDLTYSLDDLARLDKICRVIEISDDLSDRLFSPLDNESYENGSTRKWSFQNLCERIKLDDFFNNLFEKSTS